MTLTSEAATLLAWMVHNPKRERGPANKIPRLRVGLPKRVRILPPLF